VTENSLRYARFTTHARPPAKSLDRQLTREIATVREDRKRVRDRIQSLLARDAQIATGTDRVAAIARQLCSMRGVAPTSAAVFSGELFGTRPFQNGRQIGAVMGSGPSRSE
jgi:transposase